MGTQKQSRQKKTDVEIPNTENNPMGKKLPAVKLPTEKSNKQPNKSHKRPENDKTTTFETVNAIMFDDGREKQLRKRRKEN